MNNEIVVELSDSFIDAKTGKTRKSIVYNNPNGPGVIIIEFDDPIKDEQTDSIVKNLPKIFYEKNGKLLGFEDKLIKIKEKT